MRRVIALFQCCILGITPLHVGVPQNYTTSKPVFKLVCSCDVHIFTTYFTVLSMKNTMNCQKLEKDSYHNWKRRGDLVQTYKIITEKIYLMKYSFFKIPNSATREHIYKLYKQHVRILLTFQTYC